METFIACLVASWITLLYLSFAELVLFSVQNKKPLDFSSVRCYYFKENEMGSGVKYPKIEVELVGSDGNAFMVLGKVRRALKDAKVPSEEIQKFYEEATGGDYDHLLQTVMKWVNVS